MKALSNLISYKDGSPTNLIESHWVFHGVKLLKDVGAFRAGQSFPTAILHTETPILILIAENGKENIIQLQYTV